jgi:hypothetical protein
MGWLGAEPNVVFANRQAFQALLLDRLSLFYEALTWIFLLVFVQAVIRTLV